MLNKPDDNNLGHGVEVPGCRYCYKYRTWDCRVASLISGGGQHLVTDQPQAPGSC